MLRPVAFGLTPVSDGNYYRPLWTGIGVHRCLWTCFIRMRSEVRVLHRSPNLDRIKNLRHYLPSGVVIGTATNSVGSRLRGNDVVVVWLVGRPRGIAPTGGCGDVPEGSRHG